MTEFLTTSAGVCLIERIIFTANNQVFLVSPYLHFAKNVI
jgi:hypothetical protein